MRRTLYLLAFLVVSIATFGVARAGDPETETLGDYIAASADVRAVFAGRMARLLAQNHPGLSADFMMGCLDAAAAIGAAPMRLRAASVFCAMSYDAPVTQK